MSVGTMRGKGGTGEFKTLEDIYTTTARDPDQRRKLLAFVNKLKLQPGLTTCDALVDLVPPRQLGKSTLAVINQAWYGMGQSDTSQWRDDSTVNPAQIQLVNRQATSYYLTRLVELAEEHAGTWVEIWGQCVHPHFSIGIRELQNEQGTPYLVVDYRVPFNAGGYGMPAPDQFRPYPGPRDGWPQDPALVGVTDELPEGRRFFYAADGLAPPEEVGPARDTATLVRKHIDEVLSRWGF